MIVYHLERGGSFEIGRPMSKGWKKFGRRWTGGVGGLENLVISMDVICVTSLTGKFCDFFHEVTIT